MTAVLNWRSPSLSGHRFERFSTRLYDMCAPANRLSLMVFRGNGNGEKGEGATAAAARGERSYNTSDINDSSIPTSESARSHYVQKAGEGALKWGPDRLAMDRVREELQECELQDVDVGAGDLPEHTVISIDPSGVARTCDDGFKLPRIAGGTLGWDATDAKSRLCDDPWTGDQDLSSTDVPMPVNPHEQHKEFKGLVDPLTEAMKATAVGNQTLEEGRAGAIAFNRGERLHTLLSPSSPPPLQLSHHLRLSPAAAFSSVPPSNGATSSKGSATFSSRPRRKLSAKLRRS